MRRIVLPAGDWHIALATAIRGADAQTQIVVSTEAKRQLALIAAQRLGKQVRVVVEPGQGS